MVKKVSTFFILIPELPASSRPLRGRLICCVIVILLCHCANHLKRGENLFRLQFTVLSTYLFGPRCQWFCRNEFPSGCPLSWTLLQSHRIFVSVHTADMSNHDERRHIVALKGLFRARCSPCTSSPAATAWSPAF